MTFPNSITFVKHTTSRLIISCAWVECLNATFTQVGVEIWLNQSQIPMWVTGGDIEALNWLTHYLDLLYFQGLHHKFGVKVCSGPGYSCCGCKKGTLGTLCTLWSYWWVSLLDIWAVFFHNKTSLMLFFLCLVFIIITFNRRKWKSSSGFKNYEPGKKGNHKLFRYIFTQAKLFLFEGPWLNQR